MPELRLQDDYDDDYDDNPPVSKPRGTIILGPFFPGKTSPAQTEEALEEEPGPRLKTHIEGFTRRFWNWVLYKD